MHAWLVIRAIDRILDTGNYPQAPCPCPNGKLSGAVCSLQLACTSALVEMHILHACRGLHVAWRGSVELKLPMPALYPCLASWLLARQRKRVAACHVARPVLLTEISPLGGNRTNVRAALI